MLDGFPRSVRFLANDGDKASPLRDRLLARWIAGSEYIDSADVPTEPRRKRQKYLLDVAEGVLQFNRI